MEKDLEFVCDDNGPSKWFFEPKNRKFFRVYENSHSIGHGLCADRITDPQKIWQSRCKMFGLPFGTEKAGVVGGKEIRIKPTEAVFALWNYIHGGNNAVIHNQL